MKCLCPGSIYLKGVFGRHSNKQFLLNQGNQESPTTKISTMNVLVTKGIITRWRNKFDNLLHSGIYSDPIYTITLGSNPSDL